MTRAEKEARKIIQITGTRDPFEICDRLDILVIKCVLPPNINGFYNRIGDYRIIYINDSIPYWQEKVVCGHELGHAIMHEEYNFIFMIQNCILPMAKFEKEADLFCAEILIDPEDYCEMIDCQTLAQKTGLDEEIIRIKYGFY